MRPTLLARLSTVALLALPILAVACGKDPAPAAPPAGKAEAPLAEAHGSVAASAPAAAPALTGTVLETMNSGGYTYMKLKTAEGEAWAAVNESKVAVGDTVTIASPMTMDGFESQTLNRKFDHIVFGMLAQPAGPVAGAEAAKAEVAGTGGAAPASIAAQHASVGSGPEVTEKISVEKAAGADGRTIAEVYAQRAALKGKAVAVRGKVVKYNGGIMGKNWIHLRDGSGTAEGKNNDLTVTTTETVAKGDVVTVKGTLAVDRDFGAGYTYTVVVEDAKVSK